MTKIAIDEYDAKTQNVPMAIYRQWQDAGITESTSATVRYCTPDSIYYKKLLPFAKKECGLVFGTTLFRE